jgi:hypothetical protein
LNKSVTNRTDQSAVASTWRSLLRGGAFRMSKALMGYVGQPPAYLILRELNALKARVAELERALAIAEREIALREVDPLTARPEREAALA